MRIGFYGSDNQYAWEAIKALNRMGYKVGWIVVSECQRKENVMWCKQHKIQLLTKEPTEFNEIDIILSFSYKKIISAKEISSVKYAINFHPAPLPEYRGRGTTMYAIMNGETMWGVTCHYLASTFDTGEILQIKRFKITEDINTGKKLSDYSWKMCVELMCDILPKIEKGEFSSYVQGEGNYYSMKQLNESKEIFITDKADIVSRKINALWYPPFEGAYIIIDGKKFYLLNDCILQEINQMYMSNDIVSNTSK